MENGVKGEIVNGVFFVAMSEKCSIFAFGNKMLLWVVGQVNGFSLRRWLNLNEWNPFC